MGVDASYQRIPADILRSLIANPDQDAINAFLEHPPEYRSGMEELGLGRFYSLLHEGLTAPPYGNKEVLQKVVAGGVSFRHPSEAQLEQLGLGDIRYLRPEEVAEIAQELGQLSGQELLEKYLNAYDLTSLDSGPMGKYFSVFMSLYGDVFELFKLASGTGDGMLLWVW